MFQIELLSGGVFWVYAVYPQNSAFLFGKTTTGFGWRRISASRIIRLRSPISTNSSFSRWKLEAQNDAKTICKTLHGQARHVA